MATIATSCIYSLYIYITSIGSRFCKTSPPVRPAVGHRLGRGEGRDVIVEARYRRQAVVVIEGCAAVGAARSGSKLAASRSRLLGQESGGGGLAVIGHRAVQVVLDLDGVGDG